MPNAGQLSSRWTGARAATGATAATTTTTTTTTADDKIRCPSARSRWRPRPPHDNDDVNTTAVVVVKKNKKPCSYRVSGDRDMPELLLQVLVERQWVAHDELAHGKQGWNLCWMATSASVNATTSDGRTPIHPWQYANRVPGAGIVTRKDTLLRALRCMRRGHGAVYDFSPSAFILPNDYVRFAKEFGRLTTNKTTDNVWICKPTSQSCGRGITIFRDLHRLSYSEAAVVQSYVCNPLLVSGYKFDLRLYVCIPCFRPLVIYTYHDGLARYATEPFDLRQLRKVFAHLTNSSLNKFSPAYDERKGFVGLGCKWTLGRLRRHLRNTANLSDWLLWVRVMAIVVLTVLCEAPRIVNGPMNTNNTFELYGFDIIVDDRLAPWLLEVNRNPSLEVDCDADVLVKKQMLHDLFDLLDLENTVANTEIDDEDGDHVHNSHSIKSSRRQSVATTASIIKGTNTRLAGKSATFDWQSRFCGDSPPAQVGGFVRVFPVGSSAGRTWRGPIHTRSVVGHVRRLMTAAQKVDAAFRSRLATDRIPDDEECHAALKELVGNDSVSTWIPRL